MYFLPSPNIFLFIVSIRYLYIQRLHITPATENMNEKQMFYVTIT